MGSGASTRTSHRVNGKRPSGITKKQSGGGGGGYALPDMPEEGILIALINTTNVLALQTDGTPVTVYKFQVFVEGKRIGDIPETSQQSVKTCVRGHIAKVELGIVSLYK